jgi:hypothetical protein
MMCNLKRTHKDVMFLGADDSQGIIWHIDAAFAVRQVPENEHVISILNILTSPI